MDILSFCLLALMWQPAPSALHYIGYYLLSLIALPAFLLATLYLTKRIKPIRLLVALALSTFAVGMPVYRLIAYLQQDDSLDALAVGVLMFLSMLLSPLPVVAGRYLEVYFPSLIS